MPSKHLARCRLRFTLHASLAWVLLACSRSERGQSCALHIWHLLLRLQQHDTYLLHLLLRAAARGLLRLQQQVPGLRENACHLGAAFLVTGSPWQYASALSTLL